MFMAMEVTQVSTQSIGSDIMTWSSVSTDFTKKLANDFKGGETVKSLSLLYCFVCWH